MGFIGHGAGLYRVLALPAARLGAATAFGVVGVCLFAGAVRVLPLLLGPGLPLGVGWPLARAAIGMSLETALLVAPPLAWALASAALVDRGEARALFALGVRPGRLVVSAWPALLLVSFCAGLAALAWGREAAAPGRLARALVADVREACVVAASEGGAKLVVSEKSAGSASSAGGGAVAYDIPSLGFSWVCFPGDEPYLLGPLPIGGGSAVISARAVDLSDDLRSIELKGASLVFSPTSPGALAGARFHVEQASIRGIAPLGRASNLGAAVRTSLMAVTSALLASLASLVVLTLGVRSRPAAGAIGLSGPACALMVFSTLERSPSLPLLYMAVPLIGAAAIGVAFASVRLGARGLARRRASAFGVDGSS